MKPANILRSKCKSPGAIYKIKNEWELISDFDHLIDKKTTSLSANNLSNKLTNCNKLKKHVKNKFSGSSTDYFTLPTSNNSCYSTLGMQSGECLSSGGGAAMMSSKLAPPRLLTTTSLQNIFVNETRTAFCVGNPKAQTNDDSTILLMNNNARDDNDFPSPFFDITNAVNNSNNIGGPLASSEKHCNIRKRLFGLMNDGNENNTTTCVDLFSKEIVEPFPTESAAVGGNSNVNLRQSKSYTYKTTVTSTKQNFSTELTNSPLSSDMSNMSVLMMDEVFEETNKVSLQRFSPFGSAKKSVAAKSPTTRNNFSTKTNVFKRELISMNFVENDSQCLKLTNETKKLKICDRTYSSVGASYRSQPKPINTKLPSLNETQWLPLPMDDVKSYSNDIIKKSYETTNLRCHKTVSQLMLPRNLNSSKELSTPNFGDHKPLIGDLSRSCVLPVTKGGHNDLLMLHPSTLTKLIRSHYDPELDIIQNVDHNIIVVDCRYPYEYEGGHIKGAINVYTMEDLHSQFIKNANSKLFDKNGKSPILIFHCEFSSRRGPRLARSLRNFDRNIHKDCYPKLFYPEIYILQGGYADFHGLSANLCTPQAYIPMDDKRYVGSLALYRKESKSSFSDINLDTTKTSSKTDSNSSHFPVFRRRIL